MRGWKLMRHFHPIVLHASQMLGGNGGRGKLGHWQVRQRDMVEHIAVQPVIHRGVGHELMRHGRRIVERLLDRVGHRQTLLALPHQPDGGGVLLLRRKAAGSFRAANR